jgi:hypothetical protein
MNNRKYLRRILLIIFLTNIIATLTLPLFFNDAIGWILGSFASIGVLLWMAHDIEKYMNLMPGNAKLKTTKSLYFRYLALIVYSVLIIRLVKPNIITFGLGLLASQIAIYFNEIYERLRRNKYFRG